VSRAGFVVNVLPVVPVLLAHLAGVVVAMILLACQDRKPASATLALVGFGLLLALDVANFARGPLIRQLLHRTVVGDRAGVAGVRCCCGIFDVAAAVCLIVAIASASRVRSVSTGANVEEGG
jgi:xanthosine utilization system XapX-like protein